jgi:plastocyanin
MSSTKRRLGPSCLLAALVAIGCGGGKPQDASARTDEAPAAPMQLAQAPAGSPAAGGASVTGTVKFQGTPPAAEKVKMDADPVCKQQHAEAVMTETVAVNANGTLKNVFVYVKSGLSGTYPAPTTPIVLDQKGCWYTPHVFGIQAGQPLEIINSDATLHNINAKPAANQAFNIAQPVQNMKTQKKFAKPEIGVKFKCNVHPWMSAYAGVVEHPFFSVTGAEGAFALQGLPAGTYTIEAWHEQYGAKTADVTVGDGESKTLELTFGP